MRLKLKITKDVKVEKVEENFYLKRPFIGILNRKRSSISYKSELICQYQDGNNDIKSCSLRQNPHYWPEPNPRGFLQQALYFRLYVHAMKYTHYTLLLQHSCKPKYENLQYIIQNRNVEKAIKNIFSCAKSTNEQVRKLSV